MKKLLLSIGTLLPLLALLPQSAVASNYSYDCSCLYNDRDGNCIDYTCDSYRTPSYYRRNSERPYTSCDPRYNDYSGRYCNDRNYRSTYNRPYYYENYRGDYNYNQYYDRSPSRRYNNRYYDDYMYYY